MKTFTNNAAQGDAYVRRVNSLPSGAVPAKTENGMFILAHSESGHSHIVREAPHIKFYDTADPMVSYLEVIEATDATETILEHMRSYDTHESIKFSPGIYEVRRQRENSPEGWRRVQD